MLAALAASFKDAASGTSARRSEGGVSAAQVKSEREQFNKHLSRDAGDVVTKLVGNLNNELKQVVEEMVSQANEFWTHQIQRLEEYHKEEVAGLKAELLESNKQLDETVKMYNHVVQDLNTQLAEAHEQADVARQMAEAKAAVALQQSATAVENASKADLARQLAAAQSAVHDLELKSQQKRIVLVQTVERQHKELDELKSKLKTVEARDAKLTSVSEHLLAKQASMVAQIKSLQDQLAAAQQAGQHRAQHGQPQPQRPGAQQEGMQHGQPPVTQQGQDVAHQLLQPPASEKGVVQVQPTITDDAPAVNSKLVVGSRVISRAGVNGPGVDSGELAGVGAAVDAGVGSGVGSGSGTEVVEGDMKG